MWFCALDYDPTPPALIWPPLAARAPQPGDAWPKAPKPDRPPPAPAPAPAVAPADPPPAPATPRSATPAAPAWPSCGVPSPAADPAPDPAYAKLAMVNATRSGAMQALPADPTVEWIGRIGCDYSPAFVTAYCEAIADGETMASIAERPDMPTRATVRRWMRDHAEFARAYGLAERQRASARVDRMDQVCDNVLTGKVESDAARVVIAHYRWAASKEHASKYGDRLGVQPLPPPMPVAGEITLDRNDPREAERVVMSVLGML
jgi:hypothetical protein